MNNGFPQQRAMTVTFHVGTDFCLSLHKSVGVLGMMGFLDVHGLKQLV